MSDFMIYLQWITAVLILISLMIDFIPKLKPIKNHRYYMKFEALIMALIVITLTGIVVSLFL